MHTITVTRERGDKLAKQLYTFAYDIITHQLVLDSYQYCERLNRWKKYAVTAQWRKDLQNAVYTGIDLKKIALDDQIKEAAKVLFMKKLEVVKIPRNIIKEAELEALEELEHEEQIQRTEDSSRGNASGKSNRVSGPGNRSLKKEKK